MKLDAFKTEKKRLLDRTQDVRACVGRVVDAWGYDIEKRKLGSAYLDEETGRFTTDTDLAIYMSGLADRRAVITLPIYRNRRAATRTEGEVVVSKENRHGRAIGITSNRDMFSFNVLIEDANVITTGDVGRPRNFMLQDLDGTWHDGWRTVRIIPHTEAEKKLFANTSEVAFDCFIHPNRWSSFYSRAFLLAKLAIERLVDQDRFLKSEQKRIREACNVAPPEWPKSTKTGAERKETFWAFNAIVEGQEFQGDYHEFPTTPEGLEDCSLLRHRIDGFLKKLRFHTRASEFAFWKHAVLQSVETDDLLGYLRGDRPQVMRQPSWAKGIWETGYKEKPRARTFWAKMNREPEGLALRWRCWQKTERVAV